MNAFLTWDIWLYIALGCLILEMFLPGFVISCFAPGAIVAAGAAALKLGLGWQIALFAATSLVVFAYLRPFVLKYLQRSKEDKIAMNASGLVGRTGIVETSIDNERSSGYVKIDGDVMMARSNDGQKIEKGTPVKILKMYSTILIVEPEKEQSK